MSEDVTDDQLTELLDRALVQLGVAAGPWTVRELSIDAGVSGVAVRRLEVTRSTGPVVRVVLKPCPRAERVALALLDGARALPRVYVGDTTADEPQTVVMLDAGETLLGFDQRAQRLAAEALTEVHARFLGRDHELAALPELTEDYLRDFIVAGCWRGAWLAALADPEFDRAFGAWVTPVEASVARLAEDLMTFSEAVPSTLAHTDVYYGHVFDVGDRALVIDWGQARRAPLFLDLGDTFDSTASASVYRQALAARGVQLGDDVWTQGHQLGLRFAGTRYLWYWLSSWRSDPQDWNRDGLERTMQMAAGTRR